MTKRYDNHKNKEIKGVGNNEDEHCSNCFEKIRVHDVVCFK